jgi:Tol biopolymer transport system component/DNA-binding winged helix-turn-helix (wHTH) protein
MAVPSSSRRRVRSGLFEVDLDSREIYKSGRRVPLQDQPFQVLAILLERPDEVITREELQARLWPADPFVGLDEGINTAIRKLRVAFGDSAENPRFIETIPRRGYRFVAPVIGSNGLASSESTTTTDELPATALRPAPVNPSSVVPKEVTEETQTARSRRKVLLIASLATVFVIAIMGALTSWSWRSRPSAQLRVVRFVQLTNDGQPKLGPMATDGVRIYFTEILPGQLRSLAQVSTTGGEVVHLPTHLGRPRLLDLTPDGAELLLGNQESTGTGNQQDSGGDSLWIQSLAGGSPQRVSSAVVNDAAWGARRGSIVYGDADGVYIMNRDGTDPHKILSQPGAPYFFSFSPDRRMLTFSVSDGGRGSTSIIQTSINGSGSHKLFSGCCGRWTPDGRYFVFQREHDRRTDLWALPETGGFLWSKVENSPIQLTAGPLEFEAPISSKDGNEIFAIGNLRRAEVVRYDSRTREFSPYFPGISAEGLSFSKDGKWVAYTSYPDGTLWRSKIDGSERLQLTFRPMRVFLPHWSPDGRQIAFAASFPGRPSNIYLTSAEGGAPKQLLADAEDRNDVNWSTDGNSLLFGSFSIPDNPIWILDLRTSQASTLPDSAGLFSPRWSPDGRYICAITSQRPFRLMLFDFTTQQWTQLFGSDMGYPSWTHDGRYIYFERSPDHNRSAEIDRIRLSDRKVETIVDLKDLGRSATGTVTEWIGLGLDDTPLVARDISTHEIYALQWDAP